VSVAARTKGKSPKVDRSAGPALRRAGAPGGYAIRPLSWEILDRSTPPRGTTSRGGWRTEPPRTGGSAAFAGRAASVARGTVGEVPIEIIKPLTYMNRSGAVSRAFAAWKRSMPPRICSSWWTTWRSIRAARASVRVVAREVTTACARWRTRSDRASTRASGSASERRRGAPTWPNGSSRRRRSRNAARSGPLPGPRGLAPALDRGRS
jgi:hypothetical protein